MCLGLNIVFQSASFVTNDLGPSPSTFQPPPSQSKQKQGLTAFFFAKPLNLRSSKHKND